MRAGFSPRPGAAEGPVEGIAGMSVLLRKAGLDFGVEDVADALWLAAQIGNLAAVEPDAQKDKADDQGAISVRKEFVEGDDSADGGERDRVDLILPPVGSEGKGSAQSVEGLPFKAPAAPALRIRLDLARALRPLRRMVPSPGRMRFDEAATVEQIADQRIWSPVLKPEPERWLEVALVVEHTAATPLWTETIAELRTLFERQGAFRRVTTWRLVADAGAADQPVDEPLKLFARWQAVAQSHQRPRTARELLDPVGRRLILLLSDCTSDAWRNGDILSWLQTWGQRAPTAVMQLLPERLWAQSGLSQGVPVWLRGIDPGQSSDSLTLRHRLPVFEQLAQMMAADSHQHLKIPVVTLAAEPMKQWAKVVAGMGSAWTVGIQFEVEKEHQADLLRAGSSADSPLVKDTAKISADERVKQFRSTASLMAQRLAGLMSAAPVSPPIVNLIRQTLLPAAEPVHVAEVFMSGLVQAQPVAVGRDEMSVVAYDFVDDVRGLLAAPVSIPHTESVLDTISGYISQRLGLNTRSFEALLAIDFKADPAAQEMVVPFARVAAQVLRQMGGDYAALADRVQTGNKVAPPPPPPFNRHDLFPLLQTFKFREATIAFEDSTGDLADSNEVADRVGSTESFQFETVSVSVEKSRIDDIVTIRMKLEEALTATSPLLRPLNGSQEDILDGVWKKQTYSQIADDMGSTVIRIKKDAGVLWRVLSQLTGKKVTQRNCKVELIKWAGLSGEATLTIARRRRQAQRFVEDLGSRLTLEMISVPEGQFMMGSPKNELRHQSNEDPQHEVTVSSFWIAKYPVTQAQWKAVAALPQLQRELTAVPSNFEGDNRPVEQVSWHDAVEFCDRLSQRTGRDYRLPSEAEWEYACRAGTETPFHFGATLTTELANYRGTDWEYEGKTYSGAYGDGPLGIYREETTEVGIFDAANGFGLHDMHGNVWEWCQDNWHDNYEGAPVAGGAWISRGEAKYRVLRGGSWHDVPEDCRSAIRYRFDPDDSISFVGFRVVCGSAGTS